MDDLVGDARRQVAACAVPADRRGRSVGRRRRAPCRGRTPRPSVPRPRRRRPRRSRRRTSTTPAGSSDVPRSTSARQAPSSTVTAPCDVRGEPDPQLARRQLAVVGHERRADGERRRRRRRARPGASACGDHRAHTADHEAMRAAGELRRHAAAPPVRCRSRPARHRQQRIVGGHLGDERRPTDRCADRPCTARPCR